MSAQNTIKIGAYAPIPIRYTGIILRDDGDVEWYSNGLFHRTDGPAWLHADGKQDWYFKDNTHRMDGPAMIWPDGYLIYKIHAKTIRETSTILIVT